jgi:hypothetical protein
MLMPIRTLIGEVGFWLRLCRLEWPKLQPLVASMIRRSLETNGWSRAAWAEELLAAASTADPVEAARAANGWEVRDPSLRLPGMPGRVWFWSWSVISIATNPPSPLALAFCLRQLATACAAAAGGGRQHTSEEAVERARIGLEGYELLR